MEDMGSVTGVLHLRARGEERAYPLGSGGRARWAKGWRSVARQERNATAQTLPTNDLIF